MAVIAHFQHLWILTQCQDNINIELLASDGSFSNHSVIRRHGHVQIIDGSITMTAFS